MPSTGALDAEWSILLAACSATSPHERRTHLLPLLQQPIRWERLFALADHHGIQPLLCQALVGFEEAVPPNEMHSLRQTHQVNLHKALLLSRELIRIVDHLSTLGIEVMPHKGPALAEVLYADVALRQSSDLDLLIRPHDLARIRDAVRELGYAPHLHLSDAEERAYLQSGYECAFDGPAGPNLLELQWAILPRFYAVDFDMDSVFQRAVTVTVAGQPMKTPSPADLLLILSVHAAKHVWGRLVWLCDVARLMNLPSLDWDWISSRARDLGIVRILAVTMLAVTELLGAAIPTAAQGILKADRATLALVAEIKPHIVNEAAFNVESPDYFRLMMRLRERRADRTRFLARLVFTPGPGEWAAVRLPSPLSPLYRLVRLSRLAARLVRG
jgi:hypothetical protein